MHAPAPHDIDSLLTPDENRRMFDRIARRYDLLNRLMSLGLDVRWRRLAIAALVERLPPEGERLTILDIGCGTGDMSIGVARRRRDAEVVGLDHSEQMLGLGAEKVRRAGLSDRVVLRTGDAGALEFPPGSIDGMITAFCYRNLADRAGFLSEAVRVLRPGRPLVILELTRPASRPLRALHRAYNRLAVPLMGRLLSHGSAYQYLFRSIEDFPEPREVLGLMARAGLCGACWRPLNGGIVSIFAGLAPSR